LRGEGGGGGDLRDYFIALEQKDGGKLKKTADEVWHLAGSGW